MSSIHPRSLCRARRQQSSAPPVDQSAKQIIQAVKKSLIAGARRHVSDERVNAGA